MGVLMDKKLDMTMYTPSPKSQPYPGLHQKKHGQQFEGSDSDPLLCSGATLSGVQLWGHQHEEDMDLSEQVQRPEK